MPQACENMFAKSRLRAWASEHGVKLISSSGGKVTIEPIDVGRDALTPLRRYGARYVAQTSKLSVPVKYFDLGEDDSLIEAVEGLVRDLVEGAAPRAGKTR